MAIAEILQSMGMKISGSDTAEKFFTDQVLKKLGIPYFEKFAAENIPAGVDLVVYSTAYREDNNIEIVEAKKRKLPMASYPQVLGELFNQKYGIAVCGTHGKTTTSALLASVLKHAGKNPSAVIGSRVIDWGSNALIGKGEFFVIEADEFQNKFQYYNPKAVILTSIDWDHPDFYPTFADYQKSFFNFIAKVPRAGFLFVWGDSRNALDAVRYAKSAVFTYGFNQNNDYVISNFKFPAPAAGKSVSGKKNVKYGNQIVQKFDLNFGGKKIGEFETKLAGRHNALNAAAVIALCHKLNSNMDKVKKALAVFGGTSRRFEIVGEKNGAVLIDDYGHHPEELKATFRAAREIYPKKNIIAVFHPHSFSRTEALLTDFAGSFDFVDRVIVLDIYGSARENSGKVNSMDLTNIINRHNFRKAEYVATIDEAVDFLKDKVNEDNVVICIGAGNVFEVAEKLKEK